METTKQMTVSLLAKAAGVNLETIRYYERRGLIARPPRNSSNYRLYAPEVMHRVRFVKRAQELGFSLREIKELLSLQAERGVRCKEVRRRAEAKIRDVDEKLRALRAVRKTLGKLLVQCSGEAPVSACPILRAFSSDVQV